MRTASPRSPWEYLRGFNDRRDCEPPVCVRGIDYPNCPAHEQAGLLEKYPHPTDARQVIVHLTPKGKELQQVIPRVMAEAEKELLRNISEVERALFERVLQQMLHNLEQSTAQED